MNLPRALVLVTVAVAVLVTASTVIASQQGSSQPTSSSKSGSNTLRRSGIQTPATAPVHSPQNKGLDSVQMDEFKFLVVAVQDATDFVDSLKKQGHSDVKVLDKLYEWWPNTSQVLAGVDGLAREWIKTQYSNIHLGNCGDLQYQNAIEGWLLPEERAKYNLMYMSRDLDFEFVSATKYMNAVVRCAKYRFNGDGTLRIKTSSDVNKLEDCDKVNVATAYGWITIHDKEDLEKHKHDQDQYVKRLLDLGRYRCYQKAKDNHHEEIMKKQEGVEPTVTDPKYRGDDSD